MLKSQQASGVPWRPCPLHIACCVSSSASLWEPFDRRHEACVHSLRPWGTRAEIELGAPGHMSLPTVLTRFC